MGSFWKIRAKNIVKIGERVAITDVSMEVLMVMALRNVSWGTKSPTNEASAIRPMSPRATGSLGRNSDMSQKSTDAPTALMVNSSIGGTAPALAISLQNTIFNPNIV